MRARGWRLSYPVGNPAPAPGVPLINAYRWDTGLEGNWASGPFDAALAVTTGTLSDPRVTDDNGGKQVSGRVGWKPGPGIALGVSGSRGEFLSSQVEDLSAAIVGARHDAQQALGLDAEFSKGYWLVRGEAIASWWTLPGLAPPVIAGPLAARSGYLESRYRFSPRWYGAARIDRLTFSDVVGQRLFGGIPTPWDAPVTRLETGGGFYLQRNLVLRAVVQGNWRDGGRVHQRTYLSGQVSYWF